MMERLINALLIEDNPGDAELLWEAVADVAAPPIRWVAVDRLDIALRRLGEEPFDIILLDLSLPDAQGFATFARVYAEWPNVPIVVLTGLDDEDLAVRTLQAGAQDYLVKTHLDGPLIVRAMRYAIERARLLRGEQAAREQAERAQRRLEFLATASSLLAASLEYESALEQVARLAVPLLADWCVIDVIEADGDAIRRLPIAHADPNEAEWARQWRRGAPDLDGACGIPRVLRTGRPIFAGEARDLLPVASTPDTEHLGLLRALSPRSAMVVPLLARGSVLGAVTFLLSHSGQHYSRADLAFAEDLARRIAGALENARLYRTQQEIANTLQRSLLPPQLPRIPGVDLAACFRPAGVGSGIEVGGDFYDLFATNDGNWALVIGDVTGKGPAAAAVTALARHTVRTLAMQDPAPRQVLSRTNETILPQLSEDSFCTLQYASLKPTRYGVRVSMVSGGHPHPLLLRCRGGNGRAATIRSVGRQGMIVGVDPNAQFTEEVLHLGPGDALVFYTDGVTEARGGADFFGNKRLAALIGTCAGLDAESMAKRIEHTVVDFQAGRPRDDIAVLVLRVPDPASAALHGDWQPDPMSLDRSPVPPARLDLEIHPPAVA
jgi:serine phosphatase RsbU (regulator of sigma subunit)/DNA-binding NarL/FixJ family response regulator